MTGQPAVRRVQWVSTRLLTDLWRIIFGVDVRPDFAGIDRFGLWESPTGLYFFDPPCEGHHAFYVSFYERLRARGLFTEASMREEFRLAARRIPRGAQVLDVGSGHGAFQRCLQEDAVYTGLDPNFGDTSPVAGVRNESLRDHLTAHAGAYDAVCFQVLEHLRDPKTMFADIVKAAKPGGLICIGVPHVPSASTRIPNFLIGAPPHHLTWWTEAALRELATGGGALVETVESVPWGRNDALIYWVERCSFIKCSDTHYRGALGLHAAVATGFALGWLAFRLMGAPRTATDEGAGLLLTARRPAVTGFYDSDERTWPTRRPRGSRRAGGSRSFFRQPGLT